MARYGGDVASLHLLDADTPDLLPYATLVNARRRGSDTLGVVGAIYEWQEAPLIFLVEADLVASDEQLQSLRRLLAMRGDAPYLGVVAPGRLDVYLIALDNKRPSQVRVREGLDTIADIDLLPRLANVRPKAARTRQNWISDVVLKLLTQAIKDLIADADVDDEDAISLVGRALFTRFLGDRNLLPDDIGSLPASHSLFDDATRAEATSAWLDQIFNGDLLPLSEGLFERLNESAYRVLGDIMRRAPGGQLQLDWQERWDRLDFAHIPVGVLSQAYELYLRSHQSSRQRREGGFYTPRPIADLLVRASFRALDRGGGSAEARILDPAAGAGVFLLTAFRELVAARWRVSGKRPDTAKLREILYNQITGFDINEAALRFAALGLYLLSIELDPEPQPVDKLRFDDLRDVVLHRLGVVGKKGHHLGSLGPEVGPEHSGRYDIVVGNPPWASGTKLPDWLLVRHEVARIASRRAGKDIAPLLPNEVLDLPFLWRAMDWAKPGGQIAFALHARLLFQQGDGMADARLALFRALDVTSVINGSELRQSKVWPEIDAPFCLLIATNRIPGPDAGFRLISPRLEASLNSAGSMRIDAHAAEIIATEDLARTPELLKILFRGTKADLSLVERIRSKGFPTLAEYWSEVVGGSPKGYLTGSGNGYQTLKKSSRTRKNGDGKPGVPADYLHGLPDIMAKSLDDILVDTGRLFAFQHRRIHDPRDQAIFAGPLVLVHQSPPAGRVRLRVGVAAETVAYNESFYGFSTGALGSDQTLVRFLALLLGSRFALWFALVTSGKFGFERDVVEKAALNRLPLPDLRLFSKLQSTEVSSLFDALVRGDASWSDVDQWAANLYGLGASDLQVIADTLTYNAPFSSAKKAAQAPPRDLEGFCTQVERELSPWAKRFGTVVKAKPIKARPLSPWCGIIIERNGGACDVDVRKHWDGLILLADASAATEMVVHATPNTLFVARLAQQRYWTATQARLLAQHIVWNELEFLTGKGAE
ncbi:N-6 DNA methylase [Altererythrobacter sediminis]|uniref:site-specific DNA-methyltransferase (adenine-specific) n=2 Tax=Allopontixanthobacter sediminis TaxID=1689985 RepID=A0A845B386_9SPHN|nr:N-6 DNA methylase [Allopontixanthobacter sediminis]